MGTKASDIFDLFMTTVSDYKLETIFESTGESGLNTALEPWLLFGIADFDDVCTQSLSYTNISETETGDGEFAVDLTLKNQIILSLIMLRYWMERQVQDVMQMNNFIQDHDFKRFSAASNLRAKSDYLRDIIERVDTRLLQYGLYNNNWSNWQNQDFG